MAKRVGPAPLVSLLCRQQMGTSDGRVKVVGREGVESSIVSLSPAGTRHLQFLPSHGAVLRINEVCCSLS